MMMQTAAGLVQRAEPVKLNQAVAAQGAYAQPNSARIVAALRAGQQTSSSQSRHLQSAALAAGSAALVLTSRRRSSKRAHPPTKCHAQSEVLDVVIVGSGVSGLSAAVQLRKDVPNASIFITEARDRVGGNITTMTGNGRLWEEGPNSFQPGDAILSTACDVGLQEDILLADPSSYRFVWWDGQLRALPAGPSDAVFGDFLSWPGKIRAGLGAIGIKDPMPNREESVKEFVTRNLGPEAFERLIDPFVSGVYAGDPADLSAEAATGRVQVLEKNGGSLVGGAIDFLQKKSESPPRDPRLPEVKGQTVGSFRGGLKQFAEAMADHLKKSGADIELNMKLEKYSWDASKEEHVLEYSTSSGKRTLRSKSVILTAPAHVTSEILRPISEEAAEALNEIKYPRVAAVTVEYPKSAFREPEHGKGAVNGFGQLHPRSQGIRTLGTIYSSSLFPNRVPDEDRVMLLHYIGGARDPELFGGIEDMSEGEIVEATHKDTTTTMLNPGAEMPDVLGVRVWPRAIPQFSVGHAKRLERARGGLESAGVKGMYLLGNYTGGVALGRCVEYGLEIGKEVGVFAQEAHAKQPQMQH
mmetsp:Transcript_6403/g.13996  ORF Transcript_6403/g.13996 Transcript_6403/m.13996 type:complete len:583 (+) Transcript_6403:132-1880(+)